MAKRTVQANASAPAAPPKAPSVPKAANNGVVAAQTLAQAQAAFTAAGFVYPLPGTPNHGQAQKLWDAMRRAQKAGL